MIKQSYFLLRSVKYNGNKKCICFFTTIEATNIFSNILSQLAKLCNLDINIQIIVNDIKQKERALRIKQFIETESLAFLLSVHILDEGIDIPECDSVFVAKPDEDIDNLVQRISRCNRMIEGKNLSTTYLWCGYRKLKSILDTINKKFVCKIPENITMMHVKTNKIISKPYTQKIKKIASDDYEIDCNIKNNSMLCNKKQLCEMIGIKKPTTRQLEIIGQENIEQTTIDEFDEDKIINESEYYDNIIRSATKEQFRWMLESKGYMIEYNDEIIEDPDIKITISNRVLYSKYESLTDSEKKIYEKAKNYAKFLNIDFNSKVAKKKSEDVLLSDKLFIKHFAYRLLTTDNVSTKQQMKKQYNITISSGLYQKVELIKQLEKILDIKMLEINTKVDVDRFDEVVEVDDELKDNIKKIFKFTRNDNIDLFKFWYYRLIQMYKNVLENNIFEHSECMKKYEHYYSYSIDSKIYNFHKSLL